MKEIRVTEIYRIIIRFFFQHKIIEIESYRLNAPVIVISNNVLRREEIIQSAPPSNEEYFHSFDSIKYIKTLKTVSFFVIRNCSTCIGIAF